MSKKQVLMMYGDGSFTTISMQEYIKRVIANKLRADVEIFRDLFSMHAENEYCLCIPDQPSELVSLYELPEETRSLLILYEI